MTTKLMTNIDSYFYNFIDTEAKNNKVSKRELLERIISYYIETKKNKEIENSYSLMWNDEEYLTEMQKNTIYLGNI